MTKEETLKAMQNHVLQLQVLSKRGLILKDALEKLSENDCKWYEENFSKWLKEQGFTPKV